jgi:TctA family transporter
MRQSLGMSQGNWAIFITRPIAGTLTVVLFLILLLPPLLRRVHARSAHKNVPFPADVRE